MIRYLKEGHETSKLYFTSNGHCEKCKIDVEGGNCILWSYDTDKTINDTLKSLFYLIIDNEENIEIRDIKDLRLIQKELNFELDILNKFEKLLRIKNKLIDIKVEYYLFKEMLQDTLTRKVEKELK